MTAPAEDPRGGEGTCQHCGVEVRTINWALGPELMHSRYPHHSRDAYRYCHFAVAELAPPAAGRGDTDSGGEATPQPPECPTCGKRQWPVIHSCTGIPAARPAGDRAQPTQELREAIARWLFGLSNPDRYWEADWVDRSPIYAEADELLAGPLAALLDAQAAVGRVRAALRAELTESGLVAPVHIATGKVYDALDGT